MCIKLRLAQTPFEINQAARLRHYVLAEEEGYYLEQEDKIIFDRYDALPTTVNFIAQVEDDVVGVLRFTRNSDVGMPADNQFDYSAYLPHYDDRIINGSMFCIKKAYRGNPRIVLELMWLGMYWGMSREATHVLAPINPLTISLFSKAGFKAVAEEFICRKSGLPTLPMVLQLSQGCEAFLDFVKKQQLITLSDTFAREIYEPEERIINYGEINRSCYYIVDGRVRVSIPVKGGEKLIRECGQGEIIGEETFLTDTPHTANITAITPVVLMVLDQGNFQESVLKHPDRNLEFVKSLCRRLGYTQSLFLNDPTHSLG